MENPIIFAIVARLNDRSKPLNRLRNNVNRSGSFVCVGEVTVNERPYAFMYSFSREEVTYRCQVSMNYANEEFALEANWDEHGNVIFVLK